MHRAVLLLLAGLLAGSAPLVAQSHTLGTGRSRIIETSPNVRIEVVDWGGTGPPLVLLAGGGNTAHVYDDFARRFTDRFHVVGITRRGFGASAGQWPARNLDTLVSDITRVLDKLSLERVILVGHSIAGEEMTRFAEIHPTRCAALIYIDAAYDRTGIDTMAKLQPSMPAPRIRESDTATFASTRALYDRLMGARMPESEIRATNSFDDHDQFRGVTSTMERQAMLASDARKARYDLLRTPALAIYAVPDSAVDVVPYVGELDPGGRTQADSLLRYVSTVVDDSRRKFLRFPNRAVVDVHGNHYIFLEHPEEVAAPMQRFLSRVLARTWR